MAKKEETAKPKEEKVFPEALSLSDDDQATVRASFSTVRDAQANVGVHRARFLAQESRYMQSLLEAEKQFEALISAVSSKYALEYKVPVNALSLDLDKMTLSVKGLSK